MTQINHKASLLNATQALKTLGLSQRLQMYVEKKFKDDRKTLKQWKKVFVEKKIS